MANRRHSLTMFFVIAFALAISTMTQLRLPGVPFGLSEILLILCMVLHIPLGHGIHGGNQPNRFVPVIFLMLVATLPGYIITLTSQGTVFFALYNLVASVYIVLLFTYLHYGFDHKQLDLDPLARMFLMFSTLYFVVVLLLVYLEPTVVYIQDEIEEIAIGTSSSLAEQEEGIYRLYGFSANPNQLALHALLCTFFALRLWKHNGAFVSSFCFIVSVFVGVLTHGDAYLFGTIVMLFVTITMGILYGKSFVLGLVVLVPAFAAAVILAGPVIEQIRDAAGYGGQDEARFLLWRNGIEAGSQSPIFGHGPGAWSGFEGPMELEESHNSAIDYFTNAGVIGLMIFVVALVGLTVRTFLSKQSTLLGGLAAIIVFATFHNVLRQPIMWFGLYYIAQKAWSNKSNLPGRRRSKSRRNSSRGLPV